MSNNICIIGGGKDTSHEYAENFKKIGNELGIEQIDYYKIEDLKIETRNGYSNVYYENTNLSNYDIVWPRLFYGAYNTGITIIKILTQHGVKTTLTEKTMNYLENKFLMYTELADNGFIIPKTYLINKDTINIPNIETPCIIKTLNNFGGEGVFLAKDIGELSNIIEKLQNQNKDIILQEYIEGGETDIRCFVIGNEMAACMKRTAKPGNFRSNLNQGGSAIPYTPSEEIKNMSIRAAKLFENQICGVDIIIDKSGMPIICEVNKSPGLKISEITNIDITKKIIQHLQKQ